jgi:cysteine desulfurase
LLSQSLPEPVLYGGGQESGLRSGTENVLGIAALGAAALSALEANHSLSHVQRLADSLIDGLKKIPGCVVPERTGAYSPYIVHASFPGLKGEPLVHAFESAGLYVSTGSACSSKGGHASASHVLVAQCRPTAEIDAAIRFSLARWQTEDDVSHALAIVREKVAWLQSLMM